MVLVRSKSVKTLIIHSDYGMGQLWFHVDNIRGHVYQVDHSQLILGHLVTSATGMTKISMKNSKCAMSK